jgi:hypothetical protein
VSLGAHYDDVLLLSGLISSEPKPGHVTDSKRGSAHDSKTTRFQGSLGSDTWARDSAIARPIE